MEASTIDPHDDPGVRQQDVGLLEKLDVFVSVTDQLCLGEMQRHELLGVSHCDVGDDEVEDGVKSGR